MGEVCGECVTFWRAGRLTFSGSPKHASRSTLDSRSTNEKRPGHSASRPKASQRSSSQRCFGYQEIDYLNRYSGFSDEKAISLSFASSLISLNA